MRIQTIVGKLRQLQHARPSLWRPFLSGWLNRRRTGLVPCVVPGGRRLLNVPLPDFYESYGFFCEAAAGIREIGFFLGKLRPNEVMYDIGGFRGAYSAMVKAKLAEGASVHVFEPLAKNSAAIERIRDLNRFENFTLVPLAVGDGTALVGRVNERDAMLRLGDSQAASAATEFASVALDEYVARGNPAPTVLKIDVDGFELQVLQGGRITLGKHRPRLWLEIHPGYLKAQNRSAEDVLQFVKAMNYEVSFFDDYRRSPETSYHVWCV